MDLMATATQHQTVVGDAVSEAQHVLSKEDFLKLMLPDSPLVEEGRRKVSDFRGALKFPETLERSLKRLKVSRALLHAFSLVTLPTTLCVAGRLQCLFCQ